MRLKRIKLAGFKTFVDPTVLELRGSLFAILGPNGCGKSNIIDAIKWVLGESSAKSLRGESLDDVIFKGSSARSSVGQASVELLFDNADGRLGGEYAAYSEIAVKRLATREDPSDYFLNGSRCRRRDITDLFLGTGLGPRSYAVIEQGMISRLIEAKPEDLRVFLEEASGISLYRRRRHETELRIKHTRENLSRVNDIRQEIEKQLERLKRQAEAAKRYQAYKLEELKLETEIAALRILKLDLELTEANRGIRQLSENLEEKQADRTSLELELERLHQIQIDKQAVCDKAQAEYYNIGNLVNRTEQLIEHHQQRKETLERDLKQSEQTLQFIVNQLSQDQERIRLQNQHLNDLLPRLTLGNQQKAEVQKLVAEIGLTLKQTQEGFEKFQQAGNLARQTAEREKVSIEHLEKQVMDFRRRLQQFGEEQKTLDLSRFSEELNQGEQLLFAEETRMQEISGQLDTLKGQVLAQRQRQDNIAAEVNQLLAKSHEKQGRLVSLETLQQAALSKTSPQVKEHLSALGLNEALRLGEVLQVEAGYERAVETALTGILDSLLVSDFENIGRSLKENSPVKISCLNSVLKTEAMETHASTFTGSAPETKLLPLLSKISSSTAAFGALSHLLQGVYVVETWEQALRYLPQLAPLESIVTRQGGFVSQFLLTSPHTENTEQGILEREQEIKSTRELLKSLQENEQQKAMTLKEIQQSLQALETQKDHISNLQQQGILRLKSETEKVTRLRMRLTQARTRLAQIEEESASMRQKINAADQEIGLARMNLQTAINEMAEHDQKQSSLMVERDKLRTLLNETTQRLGVEEDKVMKLSLEEASLKAELKGLEEGVSRLNEQRVRVITQRQSIESELKQLVTPELELKARLEKELNQRLIAEGHLNEVRKALQQVQESFQKFEAERHGLLNVIDTIRSQLEAARVEAQTFQVQRETQLERLATFNVSLESVKAQLTTEANEEEWLEKLKQMMGRIQRLGAINLVAVEEYQSEQERKGYLDKQHEDLVQALETLENAIRKIDRETRDLFNETLEKVNLAFQDLFGKLFEGGEAALEVVGEELLDAGVVVKARPPGKRNSSIHLLSGGEKALTAIALVFAFFQLNPAPFCILDEVDAPLDDVNVGRFCRMLKQMSEKIQFIYVTHNKLSMEMADYLVGVTMQEPGVSRLVSVNMAEAIELAVA